MFVSDPEHLVQLLQSSVVAASDHASKFFSASVSVPSFWQKLLGPALSVPSR